MSVEVVGEIAAQLTNETVLGSIAEGLLIGAGAGVVSAVILGLYQLARRRWLQHNQVRYLRSIIIENFTKIRTSVDVSSLTGNFLQLKKEHLRPVFFEEFMLHMTSAVNYRTTALSDNQMFELQMAMARIKSFESFTRYAVEQAARKKGLKPPFAPGTGLPADINFYQNIYGYFSKIKWLRLPGNMP